MNALFWYTSNAKEIWKFVRNRRTYIKLLASTEDYKHVELRSEKDIVEVASRHNGLVGFYASPTIHVEGKTVSVTPVWVIELLDNNVWRLGLDAAWLIVNFLQENNVRESIYLVYYDRFFEVRLHEDSINKVLDPYNTAIKLVELVLRELKVKLQKLVYASNAKIKIYNGLGERILIAPRSLYANNKAAVYFKPDDIELFDPSWTSIENHRHNPAWSKSIRNEALELVEKAITKIKDDKKTVIELKRVVGPRKIDRFPVMGILQAARYYLLTGDLEKAKSFGYNRAVFYAWAKHYGRGFRAYRRIEEKTKLSTIEASGKQLWKQKEVFGEPVMVSPRGFYGMGGEEHTPKHFDEHIARKIELQVPFEVAWKAALEYVKKFPREVLMDQQKFFKQVYQPVRDSFIEDVLLKRTPPIQRVETKPSIMKPYPHKETSKGKRESELKPAVTTLDMFLKNKGKEEKTKQ